MADLTGYPDKYLLFNEQLSKNLAIVVEIEGVPDVYGIAQTFETVRYGQPGLVYGLPGLVYGGLRAVDNIKPWIVLDSSLTINQRIEPEQGKANVGTLNITLIDYQGQVSRVVAPGITVDEVMAKREVKIWLGFRQTSYPEDYLLVYKGYITSIQCPPGLVRLQISDSTSKKRQPIFNVPSTVLTAPIDDTTTVIPVTSTTYFYEQIIGINGSTDSNIRLFIRIDDELMEYLPGDLSTSSITVTRGVFSIPAPHDAGAPVTNSVLIGNETLGMNAVEIALKILLSGWNGPCEENVSVQAIAPNGLTNVFVLGVNDKGKPVAGLSDLGLTPGDQFTITDATNPANNVTGLITEVIDPNDTSPNTTLVTDQNFFFENPTSAVAAFRSQYDTFPVGCGLKMRMRDVDVTTIKFIQSTYFSAASMRFFMSEPMMGKDFIDTQIFLPIGAYGISRFGRVSMSVTKPPLPGIGKLIELNWTNVLDPDKITVTRATNNRGFYNLITFRTGRDFLNGEFNAVTQFLDLNSLNLFQQTSLLPIEAWGIGFGIGTPLLATRGRALLTRYKNCVLTIELTVNWSVGSLIEVSDVVILRDEGFLKIMNFETGERNLGIQLFEVIDRQYNIVSGNVKLKLLGGLGFNLESRFGLVSPSSRVEQGSTTSVIRVKPSFGQTNISVEVSKWTKFFGLPIEIHNDDYSYREQSTLIRLNPSDPNAFDIDPPLSIAPPEDYLMDIAPYPTSSDRDEQALYKTLYAHLSPSVPVISGISPTEFTVDLAGASHFFVGAVIIVRNIDYSVVSEEVKVASIVGTTITVDSNFVAQNTNTPFTPDNTYTVEGIGFSDGLSFYRYG